MHEFKCPQGHVTERLFKTFAAAEGVAESKCRVCGEPAERVDFSRTLEPHFYGNPDGYYKPSTAKRFSNKVVSQKDGNKHSAS